MSEDRQPLVLSRTYYAVYRPGPVPRAKRQEEAEINAKGWNSPANRPYAPLGELCNLYAGFKSVRRKFRKYDIDMQIPMRKSGCRFLRGRDPTFVAAERVPGAKRSRNNKARYSTGTAKPSSLQSWLQTVRVAGRDRNDGSEKLEEELASSFVRLQAAKRGRPVSLNGTHSESPVATARPQGITMPRLRRLVLAKRLAVRRGNRIAETGDVHHGHEQYIKLMPIQQLDARVRAGQVAREIAASGLTAVPDQAKDFDPRNLVSLVEQAADRAQGTKKACMEGSRNEIPFRTTFWLSKDRMHEGRQGLSRSLDLGERVAEAFQGFAAKKTEIRNRLVSALNTQCGSRPRTVRYKQKNFDVANLSDFVVDLTRMRVGAEKSRIENCRQILRRFGAVYYRLAGYVLCQGLETDKSVGELMERLRALVESGTGVTRMGIERVLEGSCGSEAAKRCA